MWKIVWSSLIAIGITGLVASALPHSVIKYFWRARYAIYNADLYPGIRAGRGSHDNPLTMEDMEPVFTYLRRVND